MGFLSVGGDFGWVLFPAAIRQNPQARNLDVIRRGATSFGAGIPLARRSVLPSAPPACPRRRERRGIPWEVRGVQVLAFLGGARSDTTNRPAICNLGASMRVPGLVARLHPSAGRVSRGIDMRRPCGDHSSGNDHARIRESPRRTSVAGPGFAGGSREASGSQ